MSEEETLVLLQRTQKFLWRLISLCNVSDLEKRFWACTEEEDSPCSGMPHLLCLDTTLSNSHPDCWSFDSLVTLHAYLIPFSSSLPAVFTLDSHWLPAACGLPADSTLHTSLQLLMACHADLCFHLSCESNNFRAHYTPPHQLS